MSDDKKSIVVDSSSKDASYDSFIEALPENDCRYAVYDFSYEIDPAEGKR